MSARPVISAIGHVAVRVRDLEASVRIATEVMGLGVRERGDGFVSLTHGLPHHSLQYIAADEDAIDHIGLETPDLEALAEVRARVDRAGLRVVSETALDDVVDEGFAFECPDGFVFEVYHRMPIGMLDYHPTGVKPNRFGHVNFTVPDIERTREFYADILDFKVSDQVSRAYWMRCNVDHHGVAFSIGPAPVMHHHAWEVQSTLEVGLLADRVNEDGGSVLWGPVRHGCGRNIATYFKDPSGVVIEYYSDMFRYYSDEDDELIDWDETDHKWFSLWSPDFPGGGFTDHGLPPATREGARA